MSFHVDRATVLVLAALFMGLQSGAFPEEARGAVPARRQMCVGAEVVDGAFEFGAPSVAEGGEGSKQACLYQVTLYNRNRTRVRGSFYRLRVLDAEGKNLVVATYSLRGDGKLHLMPRRWHMLRPQVAAGLPLPVLLGNPGAKGDPKLSVLAYRKDRNAPAPTVAPVPVVEQVPVVEPAPVVESGRPRRVVVPRVTPPRIGVAPTLPPMTSETAPAPLPLTRDLIAEVPPPPAPPAPLALPSSPPVAQPNPECQVSDPVSVERQAEAARAVVGRLGSCDTSDWHLGEPQQPVRWEIEGKVAQSATEKIAIELYAELRAGGESAVDCGRLREIARRGFANVTARSWDDYVSLIYLRESMADLLASPVKLAAFTVAVEMGAGFKPRQPGEVITAADSESGTKGGDHDNFRSSDFLKAHGDPRDSLVARDAIIIRNAITQLSLEEMRARGVRSSYAGIPDVASGQRLEMATSVARRLGALASGATRDREGASSEMHDKAMEFTRACDARLNRIFGNGEYTRVSGSGRDYVTNPATKLLAGYGDYSWRTHACTSMHVYSEAKVRFSPQKLYMPVCVKNGPCPYPNRFGSPEIRKAHLRAGGAGERNAAGSVSIGYLAGSDNGGGEAGSGTGHSHLEMRDPAGHFRYSFSDAYCRNY